MPGPAGAQAGPSRHTARRPAVPGGSQRGLGRLHQPHLHPSSLSPQCYGLWDHEEDQLTLEHDGGGGKKGAEERAPRGSQTEAGTGPQGESVVAGALTQDHIQVEVGDGLAEPPAELKPQDTKRIGLRFRKKRRESAEPADPTVAGRTARCRGPAGLCDRGQPWVGGGLGLDPALCGLWSAVPPPPRRSDGLWEREEVESPPGENDGTGAATAELVPSRVRGCGPLPGGWGGGVLGEPPGAALSPAHPASPTGPRACTSPCGASSTISCTPSTVRPPMSTHSCFWPTWSTSSSSSLASGPLG